MDINKLNIEQLVKYVNLELKKNSNLSVNKLCDNLEIKRSTLKTKLHKEDYFFDTNNRSYEKNDATIGINDSMKGVIKNDDANKNKGISINDDTMKDVIKNDDTNKKKDILINDDDIMNKVISNNDNDMTFSHQIKSNLMELAKNYDKIMLLIDSDKNMNDGITIELPVETKDNYRTTIRINNVVWENFREFCVQNKMFTQRDLLSMALTEYANKYKK